MRSDYFTTNDICELLHIGKKRFDAIATRPDGFRVFSLPSVCIIPKFTFFAWYRLQHRNGMLCELLGKRDPNYREVYAEEAKWLEYCGQRSAIERSKRDA